MYLCLSVCPVSWYVLMSVCLSLCPIYMFFLFLSMSARHVNFLNDNIWNTSSIKETENKKIEKNSDFCFPYLVCSNPNFHNEMNNRLICRNARCFSRNLQFCNKLQITKIKTCFDWSAFDHIIKNKWSISVLK